MSAGRVTRRQLAQMGSQLSGRDVSIVETVERFRLVRSRHIEALHFAESATELAAARGARRTLRRLVDQRILVRLGRRVGGQRAGSSGWVFAIGPIGHRLLHADSTRRWREPSETFIAHTLAVADIAVAVTVAGRDGLCDLVTLETEPACWRRFSVGLGAAASVKPDLYVVTAVGDVEYSWFVEIDLGTESGTTIAAKAKAYDAYWRTGIEQADTGVFPKVIFVVDTHRRARLVTRAIAKPAGVEQRLFAVATTADALTALATPATADRTDTSGGEVGGHGHSGGLR